MADQVINLQVKVNADTGALEVLGAKMSGAAKGATEAKGAFTGLKSEVDSLAKSFIPLLTAGGIVAFFSASAKAAEDENQSLQRLKFTVESLGGSWDKNQRQVGEWGKAIADTTRFSDGEAFNALDKLTRVTGNLATAQKATQVAMGLSVETGKPLNETVALMQNLFSGNAIALREVHREFGAFAGQAQTTQQALDLLGAKFAGAAFDEKSFTKDTATLKNAFEEFKEEVGRGIIPALTVLIGWAKQGIHVFQELGFFVAQAMARAALTVGAFADALKRIAHLDFSGAKQAFTDLNTELKSVSDQTLQHLEETESQQNAKSIDRTVKKGELKARQSAKDIAAEDEEAKKLAQIEAELASKIASIGDQTFAKKRAMLAAEVNAQRTKINTELKLEADKQKALEKLRAFEEKGVAQLNKEEVHVKTEAALQVVDLSLQTLNIVNSLGESHNKSEVRRAKAILALQQAIAIARVWAANASIPVVGAAIAAASTALFVAQFVQQSKAIDKAAESSNSSGSNFTAPSAGSLGIDPGAATPNLSGLSLPSGPSGGSGSSGGGSAPAGGGGGGGGGGAPVIINVGPITINLQVDSIDLSDRNAVLLALGLEVRKETVAAVQFARSIAVLADKRSAQAV